MTKVLWVVAGALVDSERRVLLSQRPEGKNLAGFWEYPGGKIEAGETPEEALCRELKEELKLQILPGDLFPLTFASYQYKDFHLVMPLFLCRRWQGMPVPTEGQAVCWTDAAGVGNDRENFPMPPADDVLSETLRQWAAREAMTF